MYGYMTDLRRRPKSEKRTYQVKAYISADERRMLEDIVKCYGDGFTKIIREAILARYRALQKVKDIR